jgi:UDP-glucose 4-epimerase
MDLAEGHVAALKYIESSSSNPTTIFTSTTPSTTTTSDTSTTSGKGFGQYSVFNLGTGIGYSVLEMVEAMKLASNRPLPYEFGLRRPGDIAICYADPTKAKELLGWSAKRNLSDMCAGK